MWDLGLCSGESMVNGGEGGKKEKEKKGRDGGGGGGGREEGETEASERGNARLDRKTGGRSLLVLGLFDANRMFFSNPY